MIEFIVGAPGAFASTTEIVIDALALGETPLLAATVKVYVPAVVGVPANSPASLKVIPFGSEPLLIEYVGTGEPSAKNVYE